MRLVGADVNDLSERSISGAILPAIAGNAEPIHPLITWWMILSSFSKLARCHALTWATLLDANQSDDAASIGRILDVARVDIPSRLVLELLG